MLVSQIGFLILVNIGLGFAISNIDNAAHLGGLAAGLLLGALVPPTGVQTMGTLWQRPVRMRPASRRHRPGRRPSSSVRARRTPPEGPARRLGRRRRPRG